MSLCEDLLAKMGAPLDYLFRQPAPVPRGGMDDQRRY